MVAPNDPNAHSSEGKNDVDGNVAVGKFSSIVSVDGPPTIILEAYFDLKDPAYHLPWESALARAKE